jgi:hypothetical protein
MTTGTQAAATGFQSLVVGCRLTLQEGGTLPCQLRLAGAVSCVEPLFPFVLSLSKHCPPPHERAVWIKKNDASTSSARTEGGGADRKP